MERLPLYKQVFEAESYKGPMLGSQHPHWAAVTSAPGNMIPLASGHLQSNAHTDTDRRIKIFTFEVKEPTLENLILLMY